MAISKDKDWAEQADEALKRRAEKNTPWSTPRVQKDTDGRQDDLNKPVSRVLP